MTDGKGPARDYSWPTATPGNTIAETHGAYSPRRVDPLAAQIAQELFALPALPEHLRRAEFGPAVAAWARAEARCELMAGWLSDMDTTKPAARAMAVLRELGRAEVTAARLRSDLGLTPVAAARLNRDVSASRFMATRAMAGLDRLAAAGAELAARDLTALDAARSPVDATEGGADVEPA